MMMTDDGRMENHIPSLFRMATKEILTHTNGTKEHEEEEKHHYMSFSVKHTTYTKHTILLSILLKRCRTILPHMLSMHTFELFFYILPASSHYENKKKMPFSLIVFCSILCYFYRSHYLYHTMLFVSNIPAKRRKNTI